MLGKKAYLASKKVPQSVKTKIVSGELKTPKEIKAAIVAAKSNQVASLPSPQPPPMEPVTTGFISPTDAVLQPDAVLGVDARPAESRLAHEMKQAIVNAKTPPEQAASMSGGSGAILPESPGGFLSAIEGIPPVVLIGAAALVLVLMLR